MTTQPEQILEDNLVEQLMKLGYSYVSIANETALLANLKTQLEKHNGITISDTEFAKILNQLNKGSVFERAKTLRDKFQYTKDNGESQYIEFLNIEHWCQNQYQVTRQVNNEGSYKNRYDVTLLVNGLPLVQIELKRRGLELKEAFHQVNRYHRHSYGAGAGLFQYIQLFVISNGINTKYYANNKKESFKQTFFWSDKENNIIQQLEPFAEVFLEPCHISKMICKYTVLAEATKTLMVLRPYQFYAVEAIIDRVKNSEHNGYIWHTTGSGKTLTSFKASQVLMKLPLVHKVVFVVDRRDLDFNTAKEFNSFSKGSVDSTDDTKTLVKQFEDDTKLIVTTIQKLNTAIGKKRYTGKMEAMRDKRIVFIFDECHRSQFGDTHKRIKDFFSKAQMFGFTGTPIFADNASRNELGKRTTKDLFQERLHQYVITDAIRDENVLKFSVEYVGKYKRKESANEVDIEVEDIDRKELMESDGRLEKITNYILANHSRKTHSREFTAMFCVSSVEVLIKYYNLFKAKKDKGQHNLRIATIFSYTANEEDKDANGETPDELAAMEAGGSQNTHTRDILEQYIGEYNKTFNTAFTTKDSQSFYNYYKDISKRVKNKEIDILLVVNMFLTGFDSKTLNTLYVDKNLKYHGLVQAYSRTNRVLNEQKSQGNIVCFRNLKPATDEAIALFANKDAKEVIFIKPYEEYVKKFNEKLKEVYKTCPTIDTIFQTEDEELAFVQAFRELMRLRNVLISFSDFSFDHLDMTAQEFEDYKSKYLDIYEKVRSDNAKEKVSVLDEVDFELELIHRDEINVAYIIQLLAKLKDAGSDEFEKQRRSIIDLLGGEAQLRSKKELIERFISEHLLQVPDSESVPEEFEKFWTEEQKKAFERICEEEQLDPQKFEKIVDDYLYTEREPLRDDILNTRLAEQPSVLQRKTIAERILSKLKQFVETFINGFGGGE